MFPDKSAQPQSTANVATHYINDFENPQSKKAEGLPEYCVEFT